jgi:hypothetical protein
MEGEGQPASPRLPEAAPMSAPRRMPSTLTLRFSKCRSSAVMPGWVIVAVVRLARPTTNLSPRLALAVAVGACSISPSVPIAKFISEGHPQLPDTARPSFISTRNTNKRQPGGNKAGRQKTANQDLLTQGGTTREDKTEHEAAKKDHRKAGTRVATTTRWGREHEGSSL